jgi:hypothetical protein
MLYLIVFASFWLGFLVCALMVGAGRESRREERREKILRRLQE